MKNRIYRFIICMLEEKQLLAITRNEKLINAAVRKGSKNMTNRKAKRGSVGSKVISFAIALRIEGAKAEQGKEQN